MSIQLQMEKMPGYLAVRVTGVGAAEEGLQLTELIAEYCKRTNKDKLLIDTTGLEVKSRFWIDSSWEKYSRATG
jgi:anti-anti-sigma regulatory factor